MQKKYINITFCYLLCLSLNLGFISTSKAEDNDNLMLVKVTFPKNLMKEITNFNKNFEQFNNTSLLVGTVSVLYIGGATVTTCLALKKIMDNHSEDKDNNAAFGVLFTSLVWHSIGWGILYRKEIANFIFGNNSTP